MDLSISLEPVAPVEAAHPPPSTSAPMPATGAAAAAVFASSLPVSSDVLIHGVVADAINALVRVFFLRNHASSNT